MNCEAFQESVVEYYLGELTDTLSARFDEHLAGGCPDCERAVDDVASAVDILFDAAPVSTLTDSKRAAILSRLKQGSSYESKLAVDCVSEAAKPRANVGLAVAGLCSIAAGWVLVAILFPSARREVESVAGRSQVLPSAETLSWPDRMPKNLRTPDDESRMTRFVSLRTAASPSGPTGNVIWDPLAGEIHFFGRDFIRPSHGEQVVLWVEDQMQASVRSEALSIDPDGRCRAVVAASKLAPPIVFATIEKVGSSGQPTGSKLLSAEP